MSDEIPVGSPPAPPGRHAAPGGWYADPAKQGQERYWDGWQWTRNVRQAEAPQAAASRQGWGQPTNQPWLQQPQQQWGQPQPGYAPGYAGPMVPVPATADGVPLAGWWWRVLAFIVDYFVVSVVMQVLGAVTGLSAAMSKITNELTAYLAQILESGAEPDSSYMMSVIYSPPFWILSALTLLVSVLYGGLMLRFKGATLGKMACGLKVVRTDKGQSSEPLSWGVSLLRPLIGHLFGQLQLFGLIDVLFPLWDAKKQALHDKMVSTQVVKIR